MNLQENINRIKEMMELPLEEKESGEKWIKCVNCKKKFTQTIHKGKKSLPICPRCGTNNSIAELNYEETIKFRENIEPFIAKYIVDNFSDEIEECYVNNL